jgi:hypothetical protein
VDLIVRVTKIKGICPVYTIVDSNFMDIDVYICSASQYQRVKE